MSSRNRRRRIAPSQIDRIVDELVDIGAAKLPKTPIFSWGNGKP